MVRQQTWQKIINSVAVGSKPDWDMRIGTDKPACRKFHQIDAHVSTNEVVPACQPVGQAFMDHVNLRQVVRLERLPETRGSRLPLRRVFRLWIGIGSLWNLDGLRLQSNGSPRLASCHCQSPHHLTGGGAITRNASSKSLPPEESWIPMNLQTRHRTISNGRGRSMPSAPRWTPPFLTHFLALCQARIVLPQFHRSLKLGAQIHPRDSQEPGSG